MQVKSSVPSNQDVSDLLKARPVPTVSLVVVHSIFCDAPSQPICISDSQNISITIIDSALEFSVSVVSQQYMPAAASAIMGGMPVFLPKATYLIIEIHFPLGNPTEDRLTASARAAEVAAYLELIYPNILVEKVFEDIVNRPGQYVAISEGSFRIVAQRSIQPEKLSKDILSGLSQIDALGTENRERFKLCARWYRRAVEARNEIDRFLNFYIVLEIYPTLGNADVPGKVRDFICTNIFINSTKDDVSKKLSLGRIAGMRADIVHSGKAIVPSAEYADFAKLLDKLEAIVRSSLRHLANLPYDGNLDRFMS